LKPLGFGELTIEQLLEIGTAQCQQATLDHLALDTQSLDGSLDGIVKGFLERERGGDGDSGDASGNAGHPA
jgi:hypothetical protein